MMAKKHRIKYISGLLAAFMLCPCFFALNACDRNDKTDNTVTTDITDNSTSDISEQGSSVGDTGSESETDTETETDSEDKENISQIFEEKYVDPLDVDITDSDGNAKNLICIYLESMETTYASVSAGGAQKNFNYIPNLTALAENNISFSDGDGLGGFVSVAGTGWTMGALLGTTSGVPFLLAETGENSHNSLGKDGTFLNGLTTLGDVLASKGYNQEFLFGSQASFGGRKTYFEVHGDYKIYDLYTARKDGYVASDYHNGFWGIEDNILFEIAKDEITRLSDEDKPFNFTMLTVDLHHVGGYQCDLCGDEYTQKLGNIVSCTDRQIYEFIEWCKKQDFFIDTTIVIIGDHPRMDSQLVKGVDFYDRTMYNCFINSAAEARGGTDNRVFTSLDIFPTLLAAIGFEIEGNTLGLGTNVFSDTPTLAEKYGLEQFENAVSQPSAYYRENFMNKD